MTLGCLVIQCAVIALLLKQLLRLNRSGLNIHSRAGAVITLSIATLIILLGNLVQIALWAILFKSIGEFSELSTAFYHSTVNFTTLGYGDITMSETYRQLGAMEALNGVIMAALSTGAIFSILREFITSAWSMNMAQERNNS